MTKFWAIEPSFLRKFRKFKKQVQISDSLVKEYSEKIKKLESSELVIADGVAVIDVVGSLSNRSDFYSWLFDRTVLGYQGIIERLNAAEINPEVKSALLRVNSPGGRMDGLFELLYRIKSFSKPIESLVGARADSAAYGIVSQTDKITTENDVSEVGSVGVGVSMWVDAEIVDITSSDAPNKWPDVTKVEGVAVVRGELDEIHEKFAGIIAEGRASATGKAISLETVNANFGQGGTMLAQSGLSADMIDRIIPAPERVSNSEFFTRAENAKAPIFKKPEAQADSVKTSKNKKENSKMDLATLKAEHHELYEQIKTEGATAERKRVNGLLIMGKGSGKMDYAAECIEKGLSIKDDEVFATFKTAEVNKDSMDARADDDPERVTEPEADDKKTDEEAERKAYLERRKNKNPSAYKDK